MNKKPYLRPQMQCKKECLAGFFLAGSPIAGGGEGGSGGWEDDESKEGWDVSWISWKEHIG